MITGDLKNKIDNIWETSTKRYLTSLMIDLGLHH